LLGKKDSAHHRAQRLSIVFDRRGLQEEAQTWQGWRLGNLAPIYEPIAWFMKPYRIGGTIADNVLEHGVGAMNIDACQIDGANPTNVLTFGFSKHEQKIHEAQKPLQLIEFLIRLTTREGQTILDPFMGSGTTAVASARLKRHFIGFEAVSAFHTAALQRLSCEKDGNYAVRSPRFQPMLFEKSSNKYK